MIFITTEIAARKANESQDTIDPHAHCKVRAASAHGILDSPEDAIVVTSHQDLLLPDIILAVLEKDVSSELGVELSPSDKSIAEGETCTGLCQPPAYGQHGIPPISPCGSRPCVSGL